MSRHGERVGLEHTIVRAKDEKKAGRERETKRVIRTIKLGF